MAKQGLEAYKKTQAVGGNPKLTEARALLEGSRRLLQAQNHPHDDAILHDALLFNQKLWTLFQADIVDPQNPLPPEMKENILNISLFIDKQIWAVMASGDRNKVGAIIDINRTLAEGLLKSAENEVKQAVQPADYPCHSREGGNPDFVP